MIISLIRPYTTLTPTLINLSLLAQAGLFSVALYFIVFRLVKFYFPKLFPDATYQIQVRKLFSPWFYLFLFSIMGLNLVSSLQMRPSIKNMLSHIFYVLCVVLGAKLAIKLMYLVKNLFRDKLDNQASSNIQKRIVTTQFQFIEKLIVIVIWAAAGWAVLYSFESTRDVGKSLLAPAGIVGVVLGFAAQKSLANLLAGFQIAFTQPIRLDDFVIVEGEGGLVENITLTYVVICLWDLRRLVVPINYFIEKPFENWTKNSTNLLPFILIHVDYSLPLEELRKEFQAALKRTDLWDGKVAYIHVMDAKEHTLVIRALMSSANVAKAADLRFYMREQLITFIQTYYPESLPRVRVFPTETKNRIFQGDELNQQPSNLRKAF